VGFAFALYSVVGWSLGRALPGWTSLMAAVGLLGGMQFLMLGIIGAYLGRLYDQSKQRPLFMIREIVGGPSVADRRTPT
jgi:dolichol-phosphate mannosyltransferase